MSCIFRLGSSINGDRLYKAGQEQVSGLEKKWNGLAEQNKGRVKGIAGIIGAPFAALTALTTLQQGVKACGRLPLPARCAALSLVAGATGMLAGYKALETAGPVIEQGVNDVKKEVERIRTTELTPRQKERMKAVTTSSACILGAVGCLATRRGQNAVVRGLDNMIKAGQQTGQLADVAGESLVNAAIKGKNSASKIAALVKHTCLTVPLEKHLLGPVAEAGGAALRLTELNSRPLHKINPQLYPFNPNLRKAYSRVGGADPYKGAGLIGDFYNQWSVSNPEAYLVHSELKANRATVNGGVRIEDRITKSEVKTANTIESLSYKVANPDVWTDHLIGLAYDDYERQQCIK